MKKLFPTVILVSLCATAHAQITLNSSNGFAAGDIIVRGQNSQTLVPTIVPGNAGPSQSWNFTTVAHNYTDTMRVETLSSIPSQFSAPYPQSNLATHVGSATTYYDIGTSDANGIYTDGRVLYDQQFGIQDQHYQNQSTFISWPMTYGTIVYDTAYSDWSYASFGPYDSTRQIFQSTTILEADAWGTLLTSYGSYPVLRLKRSSHYFIQISLHDSTGWSPMSSFSTDSRSYEWWTGMAGVGYPVVMIQMDYLQDTVDSHTILVDYMTGLQNNFVPVNEMNVFPNPAIDRVTINGTVNSQWEITDVTGNAVKSGVMYANVAEINVANLAAGIYVMNVTDEFGVRRSSKMVVER
ncbi:MAG TPA: T9SS type A sorting domain-containing protein [Bacteroidia bacterium]|nr:T9SS type A sorting domain-containing protein [Bacteroidia bacterium]